MENRYCCGGIEKSRFSNEYLEDSQSSFVEATSQMPYAHLALIWTRLMYPTTGGHRDPPLQ